MSKLLQFILRQSSRRAGASLRGIDPPRWRFTDLHGVNAGRIWFVAVLCLTGNCAPPSVASVQPSRTVSERIVLRKDFGGVVDVRRGDVLVVRPPMTAAEWQVLYDETFLEFQGTPESLSTPGESGWTFHVVGTGETSLTVTPVVRGGPNPPRFTVTIRIAP